MKPSRLFFQYAGGRVAPQLSDLDFVSSFDDRTLAHLAGSHLPSLSDGHDNDDPYHELPLERWRDVDIRKTETEDR